MISANKGFVGEDGRRRNNPNYLVDDNNPTKYAQVVEELQGKAVARQFTYGLTRISQRKIRGPLSFYGYDGHGSVRTR